MAPECCVLLMVKHPDYAPVKTRLAADIGPEAARSLYEAMATGTVRALISGDHVLAVFYDPPAAGEATARWFGPGPIYRPQRGLDLGERMAAAFREAFDEGFRRAVLVGSDIPGLSGDLVGQALADLDSHDAVLGPACDGGYYLIGFNREAFLPEALAGIPWSTAEVFSKTLEILEKNGRRVLILPSRRDIDTLEDMRRMGTD